MAIQMIENWSTILGEVLRIIPAEDFQDFDLVEVLVELVQPVEGYPELVKVLLEEQEEPNLPVLMPVNVVIENRISEGVILECRVRRGGLNRIFVHREYIVVIDKEQ